jgi:hypothetical protein
VLARTFVGLDVSPDAEPSARTRSEATHHAQAHIEADGTVERGAFPTRQPTDVCEACLLITRPVTFEQWLRFVTATR